MKILVSLMFFLFFLYSCQNSLFLSKNNTNKYKVLEGNEIKHGFWIETDTSENIKITQYKLGKKHGKEVVFDVKTNSQTIGRYSNGKKEGLFRQYWNDGVLMWKYWYSKDSVKRYRIYRTYSPKF